MTTQTVPNGTPGEPYTDAEWAAIDQHHAEWRAASASLPEKLEHSTDLAYCPRCSQIGAMPTPHRACHYCGSSESKLENFNPSHAGNVACADVNACQARMDQGDPETTGQHDEHTADKPDPDCRICAVQHGDGSFTVTDEMVAMVEAYIERTGERARCAVLWPLDGEAAGSVDFILTQSEAAALVKATEVGPDAVVIYV